MQSNAMEEKELFVSKQARLLSQFGPTETKFVTDRLKRFAYLPPIVLQRLVTEAMNENWGTNNYVLEKYLAIHVPWSIEQGLFTEQGDGLIVTAGHLQTRYGTPLFLKFVPNDRAKTNPWVLKFAGARISASQLPAAPTIPQPDPLSRGEEIVVAHDHILGDNGHRVAFLNGMPVVSQLCAISGAIQWSLYRNLQFPYWYYGKMKYLVPVYLESRENITRAPDLVAPVEVQQGRLLVRTLLPPHFPYANSRVAVRRSDELPSWLISSWNEHSEEIIDSPLEDEDQSEMEQRG